MECCVTAAQIEIRIKTHIISQMHQVYKHIRGVHG
jgi:hypothetical protein